MWSGMYDAVVCTSYNISGKLFFKPALPEKPAGTEGGSESEIAGSLVRDFWTTIEYGKVAGILRWAQKQMSQAHSKMR